MTRTTQYAVMSKWINKNLHLCLSGALWVVSLYLPIFYIGAFAESTLGGMVLIAGPILHVGFIPWFAHPLYLWGLNKSGRPLTSAIIGLCVIAAVLSLLAYSRVTILLSGPSNPIIGYGWGYYCWFSSAVVFAVGQLHVWAVEHNKSAILRSVIVAQYLWLGAGLAYYFFQFNAHSGPGHVFSARNEAFERACTNATQHVFRPVSAPISVYDAAGPGGVFRSLIKANRSGEWNEISQVYWGQRGLLERGIVTAFENNDGDSGFGSDNARISSDLESDFALLVLDYRSDPELRLRSAKIHLVDRRDGTLVASSAVAYDYHSHRFCGYAPNGEFSRFTFLNDVLSNPTPVGN